ncbi:MAG: mannonate dehydratase [Vicinamibacteraceae bacterium]
MRIGLVLTPLNDANLRLAAQVGVTDIVYYDMETMPFEFLELLHLRSWVEDVGLRLSVIEGGPPMNDIILGREGRDDQIERYKRALDAMGRAGIRVLCYNFLPLSVRVIRTSYTVRERGGARTSAFDAKRWASAPSNKDGVYTDEQLWDNLEYFLRRVIPAAEGAEVKMAMHPDDPPLSPMASMARIMRSVEAFERLVSIVASPSNGITFCQGSFAEMGVDIPAAIRRLARHIHFVHFRDISGTPECFRETFQDNGQTNMLEAMRTYHEVGFDGVMRPDHVPLLEGEAGMATGYTTLGRLFAVGYMRGLMEAVCSET